jgi:hypothetical protein
MVKARLLTPFDESERRRYDELLETERRLMGSQHS